MHRPIGPRFGTDGRLQHLPGSRPQPFLTLLHLLHHFQRQAPVVFEIGAVTVDPQAGDFDPSPLIPYLEALGVPYYFLRKPILELARAHMGRPSYCAFCARLKRGYIYEAA